MNKEKIVENKYLFDAFILLLKHRLYEFYRLHLKLINIRIRFHLKRNFRDKRKTRSYDSHNIKNEWLQKKRLTDVGFF